MNLNALLDQAKDAFYALAGCCCAADATLKLNGRSFKILKLLGEGGFSYVYLAQDLQSGRLFALKKIRCPLGSDSVRTALKEVEAYKRFRHPNIIRCLDSCVVQDPQEDGKIIYLFLPYYKNATVQDAIARNAVNGTRYPEREMLDLFLGTSLAVRAMHQHISGGPSASYPPPSSSSSPSTTSLSKSHPRSGAIRVVGGGDTTEDDDDEEEGGIKGVGEGEALIGGGGIENANVMIADDGTTPILMDFGSALPARIPVPNRSVALTQQDLAAEHCSMPFRAPELFDVKTGVDLTEAVDIWSLGCTLFAMAYGTSPFETTQQSEHGGSIAMAVLNGKYAFPSDGHYSEGLRDLVKMMLVVKPDERPDIDRVIEATKAAIARLQ
ncbi:hypothetical protein RQP46_010228 [Phenoliferia psychrophenolica]